jgi:hypothetical protein
VPLAGYFELYQRQRNARDRVSYSIRRIIIIVIIIHIARMVRVQRANSCRFLSSMMVMGLRGDIRLVVDSTSQPHALSSMISEI